MEEIIRCIATHQVVGACIGLMIGAIVAKYIGSKLDEKENIDMR